MGGVGNVDEMLVWEELLKCMEGGGATDAGVKNADRGGCGCCNIHNGVVGSVTEMRKMR